MRTINPTPARVALAEAVLHAHAAKVAAEEAFAEVRDALMRKCPQPGKLTTPIGSVTISEREATKVDIEALIDLLDIETVLLLVRAVNVPLLRQLIEAGAIAERDAEVILSSTISRALTVGR
jgi:hypothetical protein